MANDDQTADLVIPIVDRTVKFCRTQFYVLRGSRHTLNAEHIAKPLIFRLLRTSWEGRSQGCQVDTVPMKSNCYGYYRRRRSLLSSSNRQPSDRVPLIPTSLLYNYALPRQLRSDVDSEAQSTRRHLYTLSLTSRLQPRAAVFDTSTTLRSPDATSRPVAPSATASTPAYRQRRQSCAGTASIQAIQASIRSSCSEFVLRSYQGLLTGSRNRQQIVASTCYV